MKLANRSSGILQKNPKIKEYEKEELDLSIRVEIKDKWNIISCPRLDASTSFLLVAVWPYTSQNPDRERRKARANVAYEDVSCVAAAEVRGNSSPIQDSGPNVALRCISGTTAIIALIIFSAGWCRYEDRIEVHYLAGSQSSDAVSVL